MKKTIFESEQDIKTEISKTNKIIIFDVFHHFMDTSMPNLHALNLPALRLEARLTMQAANRLAKTIIPLMIELRWALVSRRCQWAELLMRTEVCVADIGERSVSRMRKSIL